MLGLLGKVGKKGASMEANKLYLPNCQLCSQIRRSKEAIYDCQLNDHGHVWAYCCEMHFDRHASKVKGSFTKLVLEKHGRPLNDLEG